MLPDGIKLRDYNPEGDLSYVTDSWRRSYEYSPWAGSLPTKTYVDAYKGTIQQLLDCPTTRIMVVCTEHNADMDLDENFIIGYIVYDLDMYKHPTVHYMYIKERFRKRGIGKELLNYALNGGTTFKYTFRTKSCDFLRGKYYAQFMPKLVRDGKKKAQDVGEA